MGSRGLNWTNGKETEQRILVLQLPDGGYNVSCRLKLLAPGPHCELWARIKPSLFKLLLSGNLLQPMRKVVNRSRTPRSVPLRTTLTLCFLYSWDADYFWENGISLGTAVILNPQPPSSSGPVLFPFCHDKYYKDTKASLTISRHHIDIDTRQDTYLQRNSLQKVSNSTPKLDLASSYIF